MKRARIGVLVGAAFLVAGCVSMPSGPSVMTLPGNGKSFDQFRNDDFDCRGFANHQVGGDTPNSVGADNAVRNAAIGTAVGAVAGAAFGGHNGAAVGAGTGLLFGSAVGAGTAGASQYELQRRYDIAYTQCMYSKGHQVPTSGRVSQSRSAVSYTPPPPPPPQSYGSGNAPPPPPAGTPPPPPPGVR